MRKLIVAVCVCTLVPAAVALAAVNGAFRGKTSKGGKVTIYFKNGVIPKHPQSSLYYKAHCHSGATLKGATIISGRLSNRGSFSVVGGKNTEPFPGGYVAKNSVTVRFTIKGTRATGSFSNSARILRKGKQVDRCATGDLKFKARAQRVRRVRTLYPSHCHDPRYRPRAVVVACGDGNFYVAGIKWRRWTLRTASGIGTGHENDCSPSCVAGHFHAFSGVVVRLDHARFCSPHRDHEFTRLTYRFTRHQMPGISRSGTIKGCATR